MADYPKKVHLQEEGPREGFQSEAQVSVEDKLRLIHALAGTGLKDINCVSFVDPRRVPQMADAEQVAQGIQRRPGVRYTGMWLNGAGFARALASGVDLVPNIVSSASDTFARKNNNCSADELVEKQGAMISRYQEAGLKLQAAHVFTAFGCHYEGDVEPEKAIEMVSKLLTVATEYNEHLPVIYLCDTVGGANPNSVARLLGMARSRWPDQQFALHLHDTRGMGLANVLAGLQMGVDRFDTSIAGLGGCPFAGNRSAAGNVCTEDVAWMCLQLGIQVDLDIEALADCAVLAEAIVGHPLPGKFMKAGRLECH